MFDLCAFTCVPDNLAVYFVYWIAPSGKFTGGDIYSNNGSRLVSGSHEIIRWYVGWSRQTLCLPHKEFKKMATCGAVFGAFKRPCIRPQPDSAAKTHGTLYTDTKGSIFESSDAVHARSFLSANLETTTHQRSKDWDTLLRNGGPPGRLHGRNAEEL